MSVSAGAPVGKWEGTVTHDGEVDGYTVIFEDDGSLVVTTHKSGGTGTWTVTGSDTFEFTIRETFNPEVGQISPNGFHAAYLEITFAAQRSGGTFSGVGKAVVHGPDDAVIYSTDASTSAIRLS